MKGGKTEENITEWALKCLSSSIELTAVDRSFQADGLFAFLKWKMLDPGVGYQIWSQPVRCVCCAWALQLQIGTNSLVSFLLDKKRWRVLQWVSLPRFSCLSLSGESGVYLPGDLYVGVLSEDNSVRLCIPRGSLSAERLELTGLRHCLHGVRRALMGGLRMEANQSN